MVCVSTRIAGGFVALPAQSLIAAWRSCRAGDFRAYLASHEMAARRAKIADGRTPAYRTTELARLLGISPRAARNALNRLVGARLLQWSESAIAFPEPEDDPDDALGDTIGRGLGHVAVPRRILRFLARGARPALIATALGVLFRCLSRRKAGFDGRGRLKASWIARTFGVDERRAKQARKELVALGWIDPEPPDQWAMNRWGRAYRINLDWARPRRQLPPPPSQNDRQLPPPFLDRDPLTGGEKNQDPAVPAGPPGIQISDLGEANPPRAEVSPSRAGPPSVAVVPTPVPVPIPAPDPDPDPDRPDLAGKARGTDPAADRQLPPPPPSPPPPLPAPRLDDIRPEDLEDTGRALELHRQAVVGDLVGGSEADRLKFLATVEHARAIGKANPCGLLARLVRRGCWDFATQGDEEAAHSKLKRHLWGDRSSDLGGSGGLFGPLFGGTSPGPGRPVGGSHPPLSEDARLVREVRSELARANYRGDAFYVLRRHDASWTRDRWDSALVELGLPRSGP